MIWGILFICLLLVASRTRFSWFSPVVLFLMFFLIVLALTIPYHFFMPKEWKFAIARLDFINEKKFWKTIDVFVLMLIYFSTGVILYKYLLNVKKNPALNLDLNIKLPQFNYNYLIGISFGIILMDLFLLYSTYGSKIFFRERYMVDFDKISTMLLEYSLLFVVFIGGVVYKKNKFFSIFSALFVILLCIGFGSRMATIYLVVYLFTIFILYIPKKRKKWFLILWAPILLVFFGYNLSLRFNDAHGIIPYLSLPFTGPEVIIENTFFNLYYTFVFGVYSTCRTMIKYPEGYDYLITSLNPAPGGMTDWYIIYKRLRITPYAPFAAIGEIFSFPFIAAIFYIFVGMFFSHAEKKIHKLLNKRNFVAGFILFLLTCAFIPYSFEYNLRSCVRFIYYAMIFMIIVKFMPKINLKQSNKQNQKMLEQNRSQDSN